MLRSQPHPRSISDSALPAAAAAAATTRRHDGEVDVVRLDLEVPLEARGPID